MIAAAEVLLASRPADSRKYFIAEIRLARLGFEMRSPEPTLKELTSRQVLRDNVSTASAMSSTKKKSHRKAPFPPRVTLVWPAFFALWKVSIMAQIT